MVLGLMMIFVWYALQCFAKLTAEQSILLARESMYTHKEACSSDGHNCCEANQRREFIDSVPLDDHSQELAAVFLVSCCDPTFPEDEEDELTLQYVAKLNFSGINSCSKDASIDVDVKPFKSHCCGDDNCCSIVGLPALAEKLPLKDAFSIAQSSIICCESSGFQTFYRTKDLLDIRMTGKNYCCSTPPSQIVRHYKSVCCGTTNCCDGLDTIHTIFPLYSPMRSNSIEEFNRARAYFGGCCSDGVNSCC